MKKIFNLLLAMLAIVGVACTPDSGENAGNNGGGNGAPSSPFVISVTNITSTDRKSVV